VLNVSYLFTSSWIYPDTTATATFTAVFFFLVLAAVQIDRGDVGRLPAVAVMAAGVLFGWTYLIRDFSPLFLLPAVVAAVFLLRFSVRRVALLAGVALATCALELVYGWARFRQPFIHVHELLDRNHSSFTAARGTRMDYIQGQLDNLFDTMLVLPRLLLAWSTGPLLLLLVAVFLLALVVVRDRRLWLLAAWCLTFWAIMIVVGLGELPSGRWILNTTNIRYWYPLFPPLVMGAFGGLWLLLQRWPLGGRSVRLAEIVAVSLATLALVPGLAEFRSCSARHAWWNDPAERWHELQSWFATSAAERYDTVWTDSVTKRLVPAYLATPFGSKTWDGDVRTLSLRSPIPPSAETDGDLILVHKARLRALRSRAQPRLNELRREWSPVFATDDGEMILLARRSESVAESGLAARWWDLSTADLARAEPGVCGRSPYERGA
jgi:hypothetical protein